jgi:hypothetical protein
MRDRAETVTPTAAALVAAVARRDAAGIELLLHGCGDLYALAVVLADNVGCAHDPRLLPSPPPAKVSRTHCVGCGRETRSRVRLCSTCGDVHDSPPVLAGRWVTVGGIARYVA